MYYRCVFRLRCSNRSLLKNHYDQFLEKYNLFYVINLMKKVPELYKTKSILWYPVEIHNFLFLHKFVHKFSKIFLVFFELYSLLHVINLVYLLTDRKNQHQKSTIFTGVILGNWNFFKRFKLLLFKICKNIFIISQFTFLAYILCFLIYKIELWKWVNRS